MRLGLLVPLLTLAFLAADLALRAVPLERLAFRAWEPFAAQGASDRPFPPERRYVNDRSHGDLAALGNRPDLRRVRREEFSTDRWGFRNPPGLAEGGDVRALLLGDSFAVGAGANDDETLSVQLSKISGRKVYNGAGFRPARRGRLGMLLDRLKMQDGVVFHLWLERWLQPGDPEGEEGGSGVRFVQRYLRSSRLRILAERGLKDLQAAGLFPNASASRVLPLELDDGSTMLFLPTDVRTYREAPPARAPSIDEMLTLSREAQAKGARYVVVLAPYKYGVYGPLVKGVGDVPESPLALVEQELVRAGIPVLNLAPLLRREAAEALPQGRMLYWHDDTHWNAEGIRVAAGAVEKFWRALPPR